MKCCKNCGCVNDNINRCCRNCGTPFETETTTRPEASAAPSVQALLEPLPALQQESCSPEEPLSSPEEITTEKDFFDITLPPSEESPAPFHGTVLFTDVQEESHEEYDYIDFDMGEAAPVEDVSRAVSAYEKIRGVVRSPLSVIFTAFASLGFLLGAVRVVLGFFGLGTFDFVKVFSEVCSWLYILGFDRSSTYGVAVYATPIAIVARVLLLVPALLYLMGLWLYHGGVAKDKSNVAATGLSLISAGSVVTLVCCSVGTLASIAFGTALFTASLQVNGEEMAQIFGGLIVAAVFAVAAVLGIVYNCFALSSLGRLKAMVKGGAPDRRLSVFVMMMNLLLAVVCSSVSGFYLAGYEVLSFVLSFINMITFVLMSMLISKYRTELKYDHDIYKK